MPIKPENRSRYPADWKQIRARILERAGHRCEGSPHYPDCRAENGQPHPVTGSKVVLTIAHLDHRPETRDEARLKAWCQRCHLAYDQVHHARHAARTRQAPLALKDLFEEAIDASEPDYPLVYAWGNNDVRAARKGQRCRLLASGKLSTILIEFEDGYRMTTSRRAVRRAAAAAATR